MSRTVRKDASALLVEGPKDVRVFRNLINEAACDIVSTEGKPNAVGALNVLRRSGQRGILVVIDSDFSRLGGQQIIDPDVVTTDVHDIEAMMLQSAAPQKLMVEYDLRPDAFGPDLGDLLALAAMPLGYLRLASIRFNLSLKFSDLRFSKFVNTASPVTLDEQELVKEVLSKSPWCKHREKDVIGLIRRVSKPTDDCWHVSCGHDMTDVLAVLLGSKAGRDVTAYTVERQLRLSYHPTDFARTQLFVDIRSWEQRNVPYEVLA
jgi:hypothetical protein